MIDANGWFSWAKRDPGPANRWAYFGNRRNALAAIYHHSLEGWFYPVNSNGHNEMKNPDRFPTAWHGTIDNNGVLWQHYPVFAWLQASNGGNPFGPAFETEGLFDMPLNDQQIETWVRIHADMRELTGNDYRRGMGGTRGLVEHREAPGAQTACPSERYAPLWKRIAEGGDVSKEEVAAMIAESEARMRAEIETARKTAIDPTLREYEANRWDAVHDAMRDNPNDYRLFAKEAIAAADIYGEPPKADQD